MTTQIKQLVLFFSFLLGIWGVNARDLVLTINRKEVFSQGYEKTLAMVLLFSLFIFFLKVISSIVKGGASKIENIKYSEIKNKGGLNRYLINITTFIRALERENLIIFCILIGSVFGLILGYIFGETHYFYEPHHFTSDIHNSYRHKNYTYKEFHFSYLIGLSTFIITSGGTYLSLKLKK